MPQAVLLPSSTAEVQAILRLCHRERIPFVARGSATSPQRRYSRFFATSINYPVIFIPPSRMFMTFFA
jgi:hypothetical protein